jgi:predicted DNA-binding protein (MmcQ/YjbR family)
MNIESVREYCLSLPLVTEDFPFDEQTLVFRILGKIFACVDLERPEWVTMKCNADYALELREEHSEIEGAWHWNKKYWNLNSAPTGATTPGSWATYSALP